MEEASNLTTLLTVGFGLHANDTPIEKVQQSMCKVGYNVTVQHNFKLLLIPGTTFALLSILLNIAIFLTFQRIR